MTRILYWNIEKFASNKIANPSFKRQRGGALKQNQASVQRLNYINTHWGITAGGAVSRPDIVVIVEVATGYDGPGVLARGNGPAGALTLLTALRAVTANPNWMLVPPLQTGPREAVAVYFDSTNLIFTGPWLWPGGVGPAVPPAAPAPATAAYAAPFVGALPAAAVPAGTLNTGTAQNQLAAATGFTYAAAHANAGMGKNFAALRRPYWVTFAEMSGAGAPPVVRDISLFCIHSPANAGAGAYLTALDDLAEVADGIAANEVRVVLGDFNVNLLDNDAPRTRSDSYDALEGSGYTLGIDSPGGPPAPLNGWLGYFGTHIKRTSRATYWTTNAQTDYYPGYGYVGSTIIQNFYSIDNILANYGAGLMAVGPANVTVLNGIVGSRYNGVAPPVPGNPPVGTYNLPIRMAGVPFAAPAAQAPPFSAGRQGAFRGWNNYGRIRSTSDHLAIVADI
ncbi:hypothetical protein [Aurantimonas endophytica]|uniref:Endonuclease/exonuclease/phosphatase domain-containing protein n=1 Tax=Aurantimonas endophytica TaxID=1522175 RepID=A0A7W6MPM6_9HYPH|nr:hypothetical protein [Aurantimonas endophytica]MBB4003108.1 hypothetical protein [Aurantimonas endophytica]MCO6403980.1 hypothetical protein [Aurantimonas endophytica]